MTAQIIFFIAVALFVFVILTGKRKREANDSSDDQIKKKSFGVRFLGYFSRFFQFRKRTAESEVLSPKTSIVSDSVTGPRPADSAFWREDRVTEKPEVTKSVNRADKLIKEGQYREAEKILLSIASRHPKDARIYAKLGLIYLYLKSFNDAIESLKVAVKLDKYNPSRHYNLALAYWGNKDSQHAIASIREAISLDPVTEKYRKFLEQLLEKK